MDGSGPFFFTGATDWEGEGAPLIDFWPAGLGAGAWVWV